MSSIIDLKILYYTFLHYFNYVDSDDRKLFVKNFPIQWKAGELREIFQRFQQDGFPVHVEIFKNRANVSRGEAIVVFRMADSAINAVQQLNGLIYSFK